MALAKCCVIGCDSTKQTQRLFCMPKTDQLRNLWMSFLVPRNPYLLGLSVNQLMKKRVCQKHFDQTQFDQLGVRIRYSYPCLFTEEEFTHGVPLSSAGYLILGWYSQYKSWRSTLLSLKISTAYVEPEEYNVLNEHNYFDNHDPADDTASEEPTVLKGMSDNVHLQEHSYTRPSTSNSAVATETKIADDASAQAHQHLLITANELSPTITSKENIEGISRSREPLMDITSQHNVAVTSKLSETPLNISGGPHVVETLAMANVSGTKKSCVDDVLRHTPKQPPLKGAAAFKGFKSKTRRFIKQTTKIAEDSIGQTAKERLQSAHKHASFEMMQNFANLNKKAKAFLLLQLRLARKNKMARRFTFEEKIFALALMKQSPKGYKLLENIFALPTKRTLARLAEKVVFECGINESTFNHLEHTTKNWETKKRLCSIVFDEVALTPHLTYNESKDVINGLEEIAGERRLKFADHALVFMVRGICSSWRQSIAYYFCEGTVSAPELEKILKELVQRLFEAGLKPLALVCDQGSTFRSCFKNLKATTARLQTPHQRPYDTVHVAGHDLFIFHDPPHLLKSVRNNFLDKDVIFDGKRASWEDIIYIYDLDIKAGHTRALPKLTANHVDPKRVKKMKVKMAAQVLSSRTAAMLNYTDTLHKRLNTPKETMATTAAFVLFFDELFDSVNGSPGQGRGKLRCAVKKDSDHIEFWKTAVIKIKNMKYIDAKSKLARQAGQPRHVRVPCLDGWITTIYSFLGLSKLLFSEYELEYFYPRLINQDPLENFFGRIRAMNYRNVNPNTDTFINSFKSLVISNILAPQSKSMNCEDDDGETLIDLTYLFTLPDEEKENVPKLNLDMPSSSSLIPSREYEQNTRESVIAEKIKVQTSAYTAGYVCRKITKKISCSSCSKTYTTKEHQGIHEYIQHREYKRLKQNNLSYPNTKILCLYRECAQIIHSYLNTECHTKEIKKNISNIIYQRCDMAWLGCKDHNRTVRKYFIALIIRLQVHNWCSIINKILNGKIEEKYVLKMHPLHLLAFKKYVKHKLRQKSTKDE